MTGHGPDSEAARLDHVAELENAPEPKGAWAQSLQIVFRLLFLGMLALAALWGVNNIRKVPAESRVVVLRFGEFDRVADAGLLLAGRGGCEFAEVLLHNGRYLLVAQRDRGAGVIDRDIGFGELPGIELLE